MSLSRSHCPDRRTTIVLGLVLGIMLIAPGTARAASEFGLSAALSGSTAAVGAPQATVSGHADAGAVYLYVRSGTTWSQQAVLRDPIPADDDGFGSAVALSDDTLLVGTRWKTVAGNNGAGAVYVYVRSGTTWTQQAALTAADPTPNADFGSSVALAADTAVIGAFWSTVSGQSYAGAAYVFTRSGTSWTSAPSWSLPTPRRGTSSARRSRFRGTPW